MYPSDFGYAVGGEVRETCLGKSMIGYDGESCNTNDWLKPSGSTWTMTPSPNSSSAYYVFQVDSTGYVGNYGAPYASVVQPVVYLSSSVKIAENPQPDKVYGSQENPFIAK